MRNILLIGGSYGIGFELAKELQEKNNLFIASRTNEELVNLNVTHISFDASMESLDAYTTLDKASDCFSVYTVQAGPNNNKQNMNAILNILPIFLFRVNCVFLTFINSTFYIHSLTFIVNYLL